MMFGALEASFTNRICKTHIPQRRIYASVNRVSIGSDNGLSHIRRQVIILNNARLLSIEPFGTNSSDILWI